MPEDTNENAASLTSPPFRSVFTAPPTPPPTKAPNAPPTYPPVTLDNDPLKAPFHAPSPIFPPDSAAKPRI